MTTGTRTARLLTGAAVAFVAAALVYLVMVRTHAGQVLGEEAIFGRLGATPALRDAAGEVLSMLKRSSIIVLGGSIVVVALVRRRPRLALVVAVFMAVAIAGAEVLKRTLTRPDLGVDPGGLVGNTAPSGHTTIAMSLVLGAIMVSPRALRMTIAVIGAIYAAVIASGTLAAGWHRPADAVTAILWTFCVATVATAALLSWRGDGIDDETTSAEVDRRVRVAAIAASVVLPIGVLLGSFYATDDPVQWAGLSGRFVAASIVIDVVGVAAIACYVWLTRSIDLDRPRPRSISRG